MQSAQDVNQKLIAVSEAINAGLAEQEKNYLQRRRLAAGPDAHASSLVKHLSDEIQTQYTPEEQMAFIDWAKLNKSDLVSVALMVAAYMGLVHGYWETTEQLGRELVSRDHHDLLAQRVIDAAAEKSHDLETETDRWLKTRTCQAPFTEIESRTNGQVHFCCSAWQPVPIGRFDAPGPDGFWNSDRAREIRRSVLDGDFSHCSRWHCPAIAGRRLPPRNEKANRRPLRSDEGPDRVILSHDRSCNISCPSCRTKLINLPHKETNRLNDIFEEHLLPLVSKASRIKVTGSGDPFGSRHFRHLLGRLTASDARGRRIQLHTNGLLANERAWNDLNLWDNVSSVWVSIDAAEAETYAVLRRGGDFNILKENLLFLGDLNKRGAIDKLRLDFVVQHANYLEMPAFVDLANEVNADGVYFLRLRNWGHTSADEFRLQDVCSPDHAEHQQLLEVLADDRISAPVVELGSMTQLVAQARSRGGSGLKVVD